MGLWVHVLPEWEAVRSKPQRNAYHRFTVDRHLMEACANAAALVARTDRPDLLVLGALLHDIGKGYPGDHTEVGIELVATHRRPHGAAAGRRRRARRRWCATTCSSPTSPPAATSTTPPPSRRWPRRSATCARSGCSPPSPRPTARPPDRPRGARWKAELVRDLVGRTAHVLGGGSVEEVRDDFPTAEHLELLRAGRAGAARRRRPAHRRRRRPARPVLAGSPACWRSTASACSTPPSPASTGWRSRCSASSRASGPPSPGTRCIADLEKVLEGRLALQARLAERARVYGSRAPSGRRCTSRRAWSSTTARPATPPWWRCTPWTPIGVLYRITRALAELDLDIVSAKVQTLGDRVVDAFYVRDMAGQKVTDPAALVEVERALLHELLAS